MKLIILSEMKSFIKQGSSAPQIDGQEKAFLKYGGDDVEIVHKNIILKNINRFTSKIGLAPLCEGFTRKKRDDGVYCYIAVSLVFLQDNAYLLKELKKHGNKVAIYTYDVWEPEFDEWQKVFDDVKPDYIFFGFKKSMEHYEKLGYQNIYWVPLSGDFEIFKPYDLEKTRLFIQMGRRNDELHEKMLDYLKKHGLEDNRDNYVYRKDRNERIYPDINELAKEISRSKYFVCVPKYYENFKRTGNINETICRFYEGMACKTMLVGMKSDTFDELFPYKAMISFNDGEDFEEQIDYYETHPEEYGAIVNKNYEYIMEHHSWGNRVKQILEIING
ncbi:MAG: glycosyltransferase [Erysipelotrichaceae bacterium]|nr:glycosyltransferase [Erysipelotrichaceae bacterium]